MYIVHWTKHYSALASHPCNKYNLTIMIFSVGAEEGKEGKKKANKSSGLNDKADSKIGDNKVGVYILPDKGHNACVKSQRFLKEEKKEIHDNEGK